MFKLYSDTQWWRALFTGEFIEDVNQYTAISRKVVAKTVQATIPKVIWDMINTLVLDTVSLEPTFVAFL